MPREQVVLLVEIHTASPSCTSQVDNSIQSTLLHTTPYANQDEHVRLIFPSQLLSSSNAEDCSIKTLLSKTSAAKDPERRSDAHCVFYNSLLFEFLFYCLDVHALELCHVVVDKRAEGYASARILDPGPCCAIARR